MAAEAGADSGDARWVALRREAPAEVSRRSGAVIDMSGGYAIDFLDRSYVVRPALESVTGPGGGTDTETEVLLLGYLRHAAESTFTGKWISPSSLPGGSLFFRGPHALPAEPLIGRFGADPEAFARAAQTLGGTPLEFGDVSMAFRVLPRIRLGVVLWAGDDEFPARAGFLFDSSMGGGYPLDMVLALVNVVTRRLLDTRRTDP